MPIRGSPNGARHPRPQAGRDRPEWVVAINLCAQARRTDYVLPTFLMDTIASIRRAPDLDAAVILYRGEGVV